MAPGYGSPALASALKYMLLGSALYEPLRKALHSLGDDVGGVGGVGGLCNLGSPEACDSLAGRTGNYCFQPGVWSGLTCFAIVVLAVWTGPLFFGAVAMSRSLLKQDAPLEEGRETMSQAGQEAQQPSGTLCPFLGSRLPYKLTNQKKGGALIVRWLLGYRGSRPTSRLCRGSKIPVDLVRLILPLVCHALHVHAG